MKKSAIILLLLLSLSTVLSTILSAEMQNDVKLEYVLDESNCETTDSNNGENVKPDLHSRNHTQIDFTRQIAKPAACYTVWGEAYPVPLFEPPRN